MTASRRAAETAGEKQTRLANEHYPRSDDASTIRKRAERQRRKEAGEVRVEVWLPAYEAQALDRYAQLTHTTRTDVVLEAIKGYVA